MTSPLGKLSEKIQTLELELEAELANRRAELRLGLEKGKAIFKEEVLGQHRDMKTSLWRYIRRARPMAVLTAPLLYGVIIPLLLLDLFVTVYQAACFPVYGIAKVRRADYVAFDRRHLAYLNLLEKLNCAYCSYANGLINYVREIASTTEQHWCPIKHARRVLGTHPLYREFADFGDAYRKRLDEK